MMQVSEPYVAANHDTHHDFYEYQEAFDIDIPLNHVQAGIPKPVRPCPCFDLWYSLASRDQKVWDQLSNPGKAIITASTCVALTPANTPLSAPPWLPLCKDNEHLDNMPPLQIFYVGRESGMKSFEANANTEYEEEKYPNQYTKQASTKTPSSSKQGHETRHAPGNVNWLLSKAMSRS